MNSGLLFFRGQCWHYLPLTVHGHTASQVMGKTWPESPLLPLCLDRCSVCCSIYSYPLRIPRSPRYVPPHSFVYNDLIYLLKGLPSPCRQTLWRKTVIDSFIKKTTCRFLFIIRKILTCKDLGWYAVIQRKHNSAPSGKCYEKFLTFWVGQEEKASWEDCQAPGTREGSQPDLRSCHSLVDQWGRPVIWLMVSLRKTKHDYLSI